MTPYAPPCFRRIAALLLLFLACPPLAAWQQRVHYTMDIVMETETHSYAGAQRLVYYNNSPDTIREVYYHLFYEAFKPGSMMDIRDRELPGSRLGIDRLPEEMQGEVRVETLLQDGTALGWSTDETVLRAVLHTPLAPGDSTVFEMRWRTKIPRVTRRGGWMSREGVEYSMSQWYPKLAEYDRHGWHPDEYVAREFYGPFGTFDVSITLPASYVVGATGTVTNPGEVGYGYELGGVDTLIIPATSRRTGTTTWRFHAENVHDFAWVADRDYIHQITRWYDVTIHVLVKRQYGMAWRNAGAWTTWVMDYFSARFGRYAWPQFTVAMAGDGGMEYPQLIMITGNRTPASLAGVIAHELGHMWYYGMLANNETQEAWLDEGFAQYLTNEASREVFGTQLGENPYQGLDRLIYPWIDKRWINVDQYYELAITGYDEPLNIFHDRFRENLTAGLVYSKGEAVLKMLQYMFGDSVFDAAMRHYLATWRFRHPDTRAFERAMEEATGMRLDWFFNQWIGSAKTLDYAIDGITSDQVPGGYRTTLELSNRDEAFMPLDITLTYADGTTATAWVPLEEWEKPGADFQLPRWRWVSPTYSASFITPRRVVCATIDTSTLLADIDRTNNTAGTGFPANLLPPADAAFYRRWDISRPLDRYTIRLRPTLWYSQADGAQIGMLADGGYAYDRYNARAGVAYNMTSKRIDYDLRYGSRTNALGRLARFNLFATNADGVQRWGAEIEKNFRPFYYNVPTRHAATIGIEREVLTGPNYPNALAPWSPGGYNTIGIGYRFSAYSSGHAWRAAIRFDASFASATEFTQWQIAGEHRTTALGFNVTTDLFIGASSGEPPQQRRFNVAGARSRDMHLNEIQRLAMNIRPAFASRNHLVLPTQGYLLSFAGSDPALRFADNLFNLRVSVGDLNPFGGFLRLPVLEKVTMKLYGAAGTFFDGDVSLRGFRRPSAEVGAVASVDLLNALLPGVIIDAIDAPAPVILSFHVPFYFKSPLTDDGFGYRWAIGVSM